MEQEQNITSGVPAWRVGLDGRIDDLSLRLIDECLSYGYERAAEAKAQSALFEVRSGVLVEEVAR